jgi:hypothetical protein
MDNQLMLRHRKDNTLMRRQRMAGFSRLLNFLSSQNHLPVLENHNRKRKRKITI